MDRPSYFCSTAHCQRIQRISRERESHYPSAASLQYIKMSASPKETEGIPVEQGDSPQDPDAQNQMDPHGLAYEFEVKGKMHVLTQVQDPR